MQIYGVAKHTLDIGKYMLPFTELKIEEFYLRTFDSNVNENDLLWHRDLEDRYIISTHDTDWLIQIDDKLPQSILSEVFIPKNVYHRLIKGTDSLTLKIVKLI